VAVVYLTAVLIGVGLVLAAHRATTVSRGVQP
jgi:hypothetical protein